MDPNRQVDVSSLLQSVAGMLQQNKAGLNNTGGGTHGDRMAQAFEAAAQAAQQSGTNDAGQQFQAAAQALRQQGQGKAIQYYANGLEQAAQQFQGKQGLTASDLMPLLQSLAGGAQQNNPMQPGQGSMLDALLPALSNFKNAQGQGMSVQEAAMRALGGAVSGAQSTATTANNSGRIDPGAASATNVIGGIVGALLPTVIGALMGGGQATQQPQGGSGGYGGLGGNPNDPLGGLGGLLGGLFGGSGGGQSPLGGLGGLLGGSNAQGGQSPLGGLGGLFGGGGGGTNEQPQGGLQEPTPGPGDGTRYV